MRLDSHIEQLLMRHECVIVPNIGGFVVQRQNAHIDMSTGCLLPPSFTVGFNAQLVLNDSLIVQSYMEHYDYSYGEALNIIEDEVAQISEHIASGKSWEIYGVGTIALNAEGSYVFEPQSEGLLTPALFGLSAIYCAVPQKATNLEQRASDESEIENESDEREYYKISKRFVHWTAAACALVLICFSIPYLSRNVDTTQLMSCVDFSKVYDIIPKAKVITPEIEVAETTQEITEETTEEETAEIIEEQPTLSINYYTVVLASYVSEKNAEAYKTRLESLGINDIEIIGEGKLRKVIAGHFETEEQAHELRRSLATGYNLAELWVTKL